MPDNAPPYDTLYVVDPARDWYHSKLLRFFQPTLQLSRVKLNQLPCASLATVPASFTSSKPYSLLHHVPSSCSHGVVDASVVLQCLSFVLTVCLTRQLAGNDKQLFLSIVHSYEFSLALLHVTHSKQQPSVW